MVFTAPLLNEALMSGSLASQSPADQIEAIYIAYFGRAADVGGETYWLNDFKYLTSPVSQGGQGFTSTQAIVNIADSFAVQPEATSLYSFLATPPNIPIANPSNPPAGVQLSVNTVLTAVYQDLFHRAPDAGGEAYWSTQILSGAISVGAAIFDIANGAAVGSIDARVLAYKVEAADYFTSVTSAGNLGTTSPLSPAFLAAAHAAVANVFDAASLAASEGATPDLIQPGGLPIPIASPGGSNVPADPIIAGTSDVTAPAAPLASLYASSTHFGT